ncbi:uncharacterized protein LOC115874142 [Sitophilus oryzae]|uniref:ATP-dependent DNA helicase n=1 Tax=Sitophilus oryzae TaxID=7048 RepID=A0A6J2X1U1_SITOR|nr:uncharacterized protein LOC115874142 [Sitophilus oryzae]
MLTVRLERMDEGNVMDDGRGEDNNLGQQRGEIASGRSIEVVNLIGEIRTEEASNVSLRPGGKLQPNLIIQLDRLNLVALNNVINDNRQNTDNVVEGRQAIQTVANQAARRHALIPIKRTYNIAYTVGNQEQAEEVIQMDRCGTFSHICPFCKSLFFSRELKRAMGHFNTAYLNCCDKGDIRVQLLNRCPAYLKNLLIQEGYSQFRENIRLANSLFAMASFKTSVPYTANPLGEQAHWCFTVCGQVYHHANDIPIGEITADRLLRHNQYYFIDCAEAIERRCQFTDNRVPDDIIRNVEIMLRRDNELIRAYVKMGEVISRMSQRNEPLDNLVIGFRDNINEVRRQYALPESSSEIAAVFVGEVPREVNLKIYPRRDGVPHQNEIKNLNCFADPMVYPLLFPYGDRGYNTGMPRLSNPRKTITFSEFYRFRMMCRDHFSIIHNAGKLFQQYIVDVWLKIEANRLWYYVTHQQYQRSASYASILSMIRRRAQEENCRVGKIVILPSSYSGSARSQNRLYLDAMSVVARCGKPDLFITFTCNPHWDEIRLNLDYKQKWQNRPDLVVRVFQNKLREFIDDIVDKQVFGIITYFFYVVEFQKRGLPHAHIMVCFRPEDKVDTIAKVDRVISARIPDPVLEPILYAVVSDNQIHRICGRDNPGATCMREGVCSKFYPKALCETSSFPINGIPIYRRPDDGRTTTIDGKIYNNSRIVPYNRYAALKYRCHINFEVCGSLSSMKYLFKYVHKEVDSVTIKVHGGSRVAEWNEIRNYQDCRYMSSMEAAWRLFEFPLTRRSHSVVCLPVHLPLEQDIIFDPDLDELDEQFLARRSKLMAYFDLNVTSVEARQYKYVDIPEHFVWQTRNASWVARTGRRTKVVGAICEVSPTNVEQFHLRLLLQHVRGAISFDSLRSVDGVLCETFQEACRKLRLLHDGTVYRSTMSDAALHMPPYRLRRFFGLLCLVCIDDTYGAQLPFLWQEFREPHLIADLIGQGFSRSAAIRKAMDVIERVIIANRDDLTLDLIGISDIEAASRDEADAARPDRQLLDNENDVDERDLRQCTEAEYGISKLNADQLTVYQDVVFRVLALNGWLNNQEILTHFEIEDYVWTRLFASLEQSSNNNEHVLAYLRDPTQRLSAKIVDKNLLFVDGPGGTGKTFLFNAIISKFKSSPVPIPVLAVAWTGIAASLMIEGKTCHRAFRLPLNIEGTTTVGWPVEHDKSHTISRVRLIVWDEISMASKHAMQSVDRYLRDLPDDLTNLSYLPFGGKVVLFGGDFRQTLPIITRGERGSVFNNSVKASPLWRQVHCQALKINLRAINSGSERAQAYADWLLSMGEGRLPAVSIRAPNAPNDLVMINGNIIVNNIAHLIDYVYDTDALSRRHNSVEERLELGNHAILCPTNGGVDDINEILLNKLRGETFYYYSCDEYLGEDGDDFHVPADLLHSVKASNLPPHELKVKVGAVVMLLRNLDLGTGLCNGCRFVVSACHKEVLELLAITGVRRGTTVMVPRVLIRATVPALPRGIKRLQFPVRLAFAMTINKSQGQTLKRVGLHLPTPCFAHGQLYVAFSRVGAPEAMRVNIDNSTVQGAFNIRRQGGAKLTRNVVIKDMFQTAAVREAQEITEAVNAIYEERLFNGLDADNMIEGETVEPLQRHTIPTTPPTSPKRTRQQSLHNNTPSCRRPNLGGIIINTPPTRSQSQYTLSPPSPPERPPIDNPDLPRMSINQLEARVSVFDRPGTSRNHFYD